MPNIVSPALSSELVEPAEQPTKPSDNQKQIVMTKQDINEIDAFLFDENQDYINENDINSPVKNFQTPNFGGSGVKRYATNP